jgi:hypothetical protein
VEFKSKKRARMGVWEAMEMLNTLIDESDPDVSSIPSEATPKFDLPLQTSMSQIEHLLQTAEAIRRDGKPEWMQVRLYLISNLHYLIMIAIVISGDRPRARPREITPAVWF